MLLKINNLRYIINFKHALGLCLVLLFVNLGYAQEIIEDEVEDEVEETFKKVDTIKTKNARKVDGGRKHWRVVAKCVQFRPVTRHAA